MTGLRLRYLGLRDFVPVWEAMRQFTATRGATTPDECWLLEHTPVYTLGRNGDPAHLLRNPDATPVIPTDRGGQITWHGPGQLIAYTLIDPRRRGLGIQRLVHGLEAAVIALLRGYGLSAAARPEAPGVYVADAKLASVGLRVARGGAYHGLALNVNPDLDAFAHINPCGQAGLAITSLARLGIAGTPATLAPALAAALMDALGYDPAELLPAAEDSFPVHPTPVP